VQPSLRPRRRIERELRPGRHLRYERLSDPILVTRAKDGDRQALATLCERHAARIQRTARHVLRDEEDARDAAQEALAALCTKLGQFRGEAALTTWLHRLTINACRDVALRRQRRPWEPLDDDARVSPDPSPAHEAERSELREELRAGLASLPQAQAEVLVLADALGYTFREISDTSGMPVGTAKCYAHRARAGLRNRLTTREPAA